MAHTCSWSRQLNVRKRQFMVDLILEALVFKEDREEHPLLRDELVQICGVPAVHLIIAFYETLPWAVLAICHRVNFRIGLVFVLYSDRKMRVCKIPRE